MRKRGKMFLRLFGLLLALSGCTAFPEVEAVETPAVASAAYPALVSFDLFDTTDVPRATEKESELLAARAADLRRRAGLLTSPVIDDDTRDRMTTGVN